jgi:SHS2 domain-containing protein
VEFDQSSWKIRAELYGEEFDLEKHPQGTEVKAITYSNMQVHEDGEKKEVFVIIDI